MAYPYRDICMDMGIDMGTIFIQRGGDEYHSTRTHGFPLTSLNIGYNGFPRNLRVLGLSLQEFESLVSPKPKFSPK